MKRKLAGGEYFVHTPKIGFRGTTKDVDDKKKLLYELSTITTQKPNARWLFWFRTPVWIYYKNLKGKWKFFKRSAEKLSIYDDEERLKTEKLMTNYLKRQGFFNASVSSRVKYKKIRKLAKVRYRIRPGDKYYVGSFHFTTTDSLLLDELEGLDNSTLFKLGSPISEELYYLEKKRAASYLQDKGYAYFAEDYIQEIEIDTTKNLQFLDVRIKILKPKSSPTHEIYEIGNITVFADYDINRELGYRSDTIIDGIRFLYDDINQIVSPQNLSSKIHFRKGQLFSQNDLNKTRRSLSLFEFYRFSTIKYVPSETEDHVVNVNIYLSKGFKRSIGGGVNLKYGRSSKGSLVEGSNFVAGGINFSWINKNSLRGGEVFGFRPEVQVEYNPKISKFSVLDLSLSTDITTNKFVDIFRIFRFLSARTRLKKQYDAFKDDANTRISLLVHSQKVLVAYRTRSIETKISYDLLKNNKERIIFNQIGIDYLNIDRINSVYKETILNKNPFLAKSLENQLFTGLFYKSFNYFKGSKKNEKVGFSWSMYVNHDISGLEILAFNEFLKLFNTKLSPRRFNFAKFTRLDLELRLLYKFNPKTAFAYRFFAGAGVPFGNSEVLPYVKQYYVGGYNSLRGWKIRELGPGSYRDSIDVSIFYQQGDMRLEMNLEYRFNIYKWLGGAFFVDSGNIWTLKDDPSRPGAKISKDFKNEIAVATGIGARFDFGLALLRVDLGHKTRTPYPLKDGTYWQAKLSTWSNYHVSIGLDYPF